MSEALRIDRGPWTNRPHRLFVLCLLLVALRALVGFAPMGPDLPARVIASGDARVPAAVQSAEPSRRSFAVKAFGALEAIAPVAVLDAPRREPLPAAPPWPRPAAPVALPAANHTYEATGPPSARDLVRA